MALDNGVELTWLGHATWILKTPGGKRLLIDPWLNGNPAAPMGVDEIGKVDAILITHGHSDHTGDVLSAAEACRPEAIVMMIELGDYLGSQGLENILDPNIGGTVEAAEGVHVTVVPACHSSSIEVDGKPMYVGDPTGFVIRLENDYRVYIAGDTGVFGDMALIARLYRPDLAVLPIGGHYTMGPFEAAEAIRLLGVKKVVPTHYGTFPLVGGTPDQLREAAADVAGLEVLDVPPGGTVR